MSQRRGSTKTSTDVNQNTQASYIYDAWGNILQTNGTVINPYLYIGELGYYADGDSGMYLLTQRWYNPLVGRFVVRDPMRHEDAYSASQGLYLYSVNNPPNFIDPVGLFSKKFCKQWYDKCIDEVEESYLDCWDSMLGPEDIPGYIFQNTGCLGICLIGCLLAPVPAYQTCTTGCFAGCQFTVNMIKCAAAAIVCGKLARRGEKECKELYQECCQAAKD